MLVVDDRVDSRELIADELQDLGLEVVQAFDGKNGWEQFVEYSFDLVVTDLRMPRSDGMHLLRQIRSPQSPKPQVPVLILSAFGTLPIASEAGNAGATAFYSYDAAGIDELKVKVVELLNSGGEELPTELLGDSAEILEVRDLLRAHAKLRTPVLICGETGSGRSACARFIHDLGVGSHLPFMTISENEDPPSNDQPACTMYVQDFDSHSTESQRRWYQRIRELEFSEDGDQHRILTSISDNLGSVSTGGCLDSMISKNMSPFRINMPPLRRRAEDIRVIAASLLSRAEIRIGRRGYELDAEALSLLCKHNWYENITELDRVLESIVASAHDRRISRQMVSSALSRVEAPLARIATEEARKERDTLIRLWAENLSYTGVADALGVTRNTAKNRMAKYNLVPGHGGLPSSTQRGR